MSYKPDQNDWMAYLYGELEGAEKEKMEQYLLSSPEARKELEHFQQLRKLMSTVEDKEVIAPPIVVNDNRQRFIWNTPAIRIISGIAASLLIIMLVGRLTGAQIGMSGDEFRISFGGREKPQPVTVQPPATPALSAEQVQQMINASMDQNNLAMQASWKETQQKLDASIRTNLASNSSQINTLMKEASNASQQQIQQYVSGLQNENMRLVKDYFQLTASEQKDYIENLLVDFSKYIQQQRKDDLQIVQTQMANMQQNTNVFRQETEQILSSIITTMGNGGVKTVKETQY